MATTLLDGAMKRDDGLVAAVVVEYYLCMEVPARLSRHQRLWTSTT